MTFTIPCFVRVTAPWERHALLEWLKAIGYYVFVTDKAHTSFVYAERTLDRNCSDYALGTLAKDSINCGINVELFKALANDLEQWFTNEHGEFIRCPDTVVTKAVVQSLSGFRKATVEEIVVYFRKQEI